MVRAKDAHFGEAVQRTNVFHPRLKKCKHGIFKKKDQK
jgi:hypothetical protein